MIKKSFFPYIVVFSTVFIGLIWRPFLIGFYGDDISHAIAETWEEALFYGRRERFFYFFPIAIPRYFFGHEQIGWGFYAITVAGLSAMAFYSFFLTILARIPETREKAIPASAIAAILYIFMPWSLTPVLWNTALSQLVMVALLALAGTVLFAKISQFLKILLFVFLFSVSSLIYESIWGAWIPLVLIKLILDEPSNRRKTFVLAGWSAIAQIGLILNFIPSYGMEGRVLSGGGFAEFSKIMLFLENIFVRFPFEMLSSMGVAGLVALPLAVVVHLWLVKNRNSLLGQSFWLITLACLAGVLGGILVVSLGDYRISATTDDARFLSAVSLWISLYIGMIGSVLIANGYKKIQALACLVCLLIIASFFLRSSDWVQGYFYQRYIIENIPMEKIVNLVNDADNQEENNQQPMLLVEFDTPIHLFHGWGNSRGIMFITNEIRKKTGVEFEGVSADGRLFKNILEGSRLYQPRCANLNETIDDRVLANTIVYWRVKTNEVKKITAPFSTGCTRVVHKYEALGELLYPFMGNPRRP